jgi:CRISPR/Cas system CSM-associated protein Csm3 (group 7 of RAMP superfamily)
MKIMVPKVESEGSYEVEIALTALGKIGILTIPIVIQVEDQSFLHIGASPSPLTEKKGAVFKVDRTPVIPASSFKGALRNQIELLFSTEVDTLVKVFNLPENHKDLLKPCIPDSRPSEAERDLIQSKHYRSTHCEVKIGEGKELVSEEGLCPVCYFMGSAGIMGCVRVPNFFPKAHQGNILVDQTNIRLDRKTGTKVDRALVNSEQVKPGTQFTGTIEIVDSTPIGIEFGKPRMIAGKVVDPWLNDWQEPDLTTRKKILLERILSPALQNISKLGGQKSKGGGKVLVTVSV